MTLRSHRRIGQVARFVLACLLFTQAALAANGCLMPAGKLANVLAAADASGCDESSGINLNLCHADCTADHQSLDTGEPVPLSPPQAAVLVVPLFPFLAHPIFNTVPVEYTGDPPKLIRFCSFQI